MDFTYGYKIYLHERGQFWPGGDMAGLGQTESIYLNINTLSLGQFQLVRRRTLQSGVRPCQEGEENYSFTRCLFQFLAERVGCHLDWAGGHTITNYPTCRSLADLKIYSQLMEEIVHYSWLRLTRESGCYRKCQHLQYKFNKVHSAIFSSSQVMPSLVNPAERGTNYLGCELLLSFHPDGREDHGGGAGGAAGLRHRGSHQWHRWGSRTVPGLVNPLPRKDSNMKILTQIFLKSIFFYFD